MIFAAKSMNHRMRHAVLFPEKYAFSIAGYFADAGRVYAWMYFEAEKNVIVHLPLVFYQDGVHGFIPCFLVSKKCIYRTGNCTDDFTYAHERLLCCVGWVCGSTDDTTKEPGTPKPDPQRDERIPIGPVDV